MTRTEHETTHSIQLPLSVVIATRRPWTAMRNVLDALLPQIDDVGGEVIVVSSNHDSPPPRDILCWINVPGDRNLPRLRVLGVRHAQGAIIATGEDHAVPRPGWCAAILRAHADHPNRAAVAGAAVNATTGSVSARANFLSYAAAFVPPMTSLPMPPPYTLLSFKRGALDALDERPGALEARLLPELYARNDIVVDDRIVVDHYQDLGFLRSLDNVFVSARTSYGYALAGASRRRCREVAWWVLRNVPRAYVVAARSRVPSGLAGAWLLANVAVRALTMALGGVMGALVGPGRAPDRTN